MSYKIEIKNNLMNITGIPCNVNPVLSSTGKSYLVASINQVTDTVVNDKVMRLNLNATIKADDNDKPEKSIKLG